MTATVGDNSGAVHPQKLRSLVERIEKMNEEIAEIREDVKTIFAEAKGAGFDTKTIRKVLKLRAMDADKRREEEAMLDLYCRALNLE